VFSNLDHLRSIVHHALRSVFLRFLALSPEARSKPNVVRVLKFSVCKPAARRRKKFARSGRRLIFSLAVSVSRNC
jgi:hypothetical protein